MDAHTEVKLEALLYVLPDQLERLATAQERIARAAELQACAAIISIPSGELIDHDVRTAARTRIREMMKS